VFQAMRKATVVPKYNLIWTMSAMVGDECVAVSLGWMKWLVMDDECDSWGGCTSTIGLRIYFAHHSFSACTHNNPHSSLNTVIHLPYTFASSRPSHTVTIRATLSTCTSHPPSSSPPLSSYPSQPPHSTAAASASTTSAVKTSTTMPQPELHV
jgi:hypothetical protein